MLNSEALINKLQADNRLLRIENEKLKHLLSNIEHRGMEKNIKLKRKQIYWGEIELTETKDNSKKLREGKEKWAVLLEIQSKGIRIWP